jgi:hypothetical protein
MRFLETPCRRRLTTRMCQNWGGNCEVATLPIEGVHPHLRVFIVGLDCVQASNEAFRPRADPLTLRILRKIQ